MKRFTTSTTRNHILSLKNPPHLQNISQITASTSFVFLKSVLLPVCGQQQQQQQMVFYGGAIIRRQMSTSSNTTDDPSLSSSSENLDLSTTNNTQNEEEAKIAEQFFSASQEGKDPTENEQPADSQQPDTTTSTSTTQEFDLSHLTTPGRSTRDVVMDFCTYIIPNSKQHNVTNVLMKMTRYYPEAVLAIYDEMDAGVKNLMAPSLISAIVVSLINVKQPEAALTMLKQYNPNPTVSRNMLAECLAYAALGDLQQLTKRFDEFEFSERKQRIFTFTRVVTKLAEWNHGDVLLSFLSSHNDLFIPTKNLLEVLHHFLENGSPQVAQQLVFKYDKRIKYAVSKNLINEEELERLENAFQELMSKGEGEVEVEEASGQQ